MRKLPTISISSLSSRKKDTKVRISGTIQELSVFPTKSNENMAVVRISDESGSIEVFVFPILYKQTAQLLTKGTIITIQGRTFLDPGEEMKMVAESCFHSN